MGAHIFRLLYILLFWNKQYLSGAYGHIIYISGVLNLYSQEITDIYISDKKELMKKRDEERK